METQAESTRATLGRVVGFLSGVVVAGLCGLSALGDIVRAISALTLSAVSDADEVERIDVTPVVVSSMVWVVLAVIAALLAYVVLTPGRSRRVTALAVIGIAVLAIGYGIDSYAAYRSTSF